MKNKALHKTAPDTHILTIVIISSKYSSLSIDPDGNSSAG